MIANFGARVRAFAVLSLFSLAAACSGAAEGAADSSAAGAVDTANAGPTGRVINVEVREVTSSGFSEQIRLTGTVTANRDVVISAEESGVIRELPVAKGSNVSAGQVIARIDDRILRAQVAQARSQAEITKEVADRRSRLFSDDKVGSELAVLEARSAAQSAEANLDALTERLNRTAIRAPVSGVLESREVEVGTMVSMGTPVARIIEVNPVKITAGVPERFAGDVSRGSRARVTFDVLPGRVFEANISYVGTAVNPSNRTFPIEMVLPNSNRSMKPAMVANVEVVKQNLTETIVVPQEALVRVENGFVVFVVEDTGDRTVARVRRITTGPSQRNQVVVTSGLELGDRLVVVGQQQLANGDRVSVVNAASAAIVRQPADTAGGM